MIDDVFGSGHEQVVLCHDEESGLRAVIALYSTALGPAMGGTRFYPYRSAQAALDDALRLSTAMAYKNALAGLDHGGGKAVIIGDPDKHKSETVLRAYGRFVHGLNGRYLTACDVGTFSPDMDVVARETPYVTGRTVANGGAGDSSILTAWGVYQGMRAAAQHRWGSPDLGGKRVGIAGAGKVGSRLTELLIEADARVTITDPNRSAIDALVGRFPGVDVVAGTEELIDVDLDVYSPCAMGGAVSRASLASLKAEIVCGGANNQLAEAGIDREMAARGILYAPDYCVNSGGVIQIADELQGFNFERAKARATGIFDTTLRVLELAASTGVTTAVAADQLAEERIAGVSRLLRLYRGA
ncbi:Glu/Leu/Phe/Val dehydrogenase dimerization domain-containing protein [Cryptosporangium arvum]|uniref:Glutamate dehydrogenase/leucine dehydrogenase n=1 Tax=Cryptosporangium arvum DSM 44712 TaxID=927661 RepID=A0A010YQU2_9ACTN|nr:Glu/Leu/Phe/Val dehydrogenase dimerization domain-containing protein [Cryptosporangium arvum]EXG82575.1 glutamate dehydrogenase/leucine dehydrogenase [Cryptosporangium arvum DSM 44712]